jgi:hypothetical protein
VFSDIELDGPVDNAASGAASSSKKEKKKAKGKEKASNNKITLNVEPHGGEGLTQTMHKVQGGDARYQGHWAKGLPHKDADQDTKDKTDNEIKATQWVRIIHLSCDYSDHCPSSTTQRFLLANMAGKSGSFKKTKEWTFTIFQSSRNF